MGCPSMMPGFRFKDNVVVVAFRRRNCGHATEVFVEQVDDFRPGQIIDVNFHGRLSHRLIEAGTEKVFDGLVF